MAAVAANSDADSEHVEIVPAAPCSVLCDCISAGGILYDDGFMVEEQARGWMVGIGAKVI